MYSKSLLALAAVGAVSASPVLNVRQASSVASSVASAASSAASSAVASVTSGASSAAGSATSAVSSAVGTASSAASSAVSSGTASSSAAASSASAGTETFPAYPCPAGTLLTYAEANQTFPVSITQLTQAAGEFATSPIFPNITASEGGNTVGATHTFNLMGLNVSEVLVNVTTNSTSGSAIWNWNNTAPVTISGINGIEGLQLANYSTVLQLYDPDFTTTGTIGNSSIAVTFTNACFSNQEQGAAVLGLLAGLELGNLATAVQGNSTSGGSSSSAMPSMMTSSMASMASSSAASGASSATSAAASGASSATSAAASGAASATSVVASAASGAASAAASAVSSAA